MTTSQTTKTTTEQFFTELLEDPVQQELLQTATDPQSFAERVVELGQEKGFSFNKEEVLEQMAMEAQMGEELNEEELERVAGGIWCTEFFRRLFGGGRGSMQSALDAAAPHPDAWVPESRRDSGVGLEPGTQWNLRDEL